MTEHVEFLRCKGSCTGLSDSARVKIANCWKSHVVGYMLFQGTEHVVDFNVERFVNNGGTSWIQRGLSCLEVNRRDE